MNACLVGAPLAPGFRTAATACGLKKNGALDLMMVVADAPCSAAGVFTSNRVKAAPVLYDREVLSQSAGQMRAVCWLVVSKRTTASMTACGSWLVAPLSR